MEKCIDGSSDGMMDGEMKEWIQGSVGWIDEEKMIGGQNDG